jgi:hypothetical protein
MRSQPEIIGNDYLAMGTLERKDWQEISTRETFPQEIIKRMHIFKDVWDFKPGGWYPNDK